MLSICASMTAVVTFPPPLKRWILLPVNYLKASKRRASALAANEDAIKCRSVAADREGVRSDFVPFMQNWYWHKGIKAALIPRNVDRIGAIRVESKTSIFFSFSPRQSPNRCFSHRVDLRCINDDFFFFFLRRSNWRRKERWWWNVLCSFVNKKQNKKRGKTKHLRM